MLRPETVRWSIGIGVSIVAIVASLFFIRPYKSLSYEIISSPLIMNAAGLPVEVRAGGLVLGAPYYARVRFMASGTAPILASDHEAPVHIVTGPNATIVTATVRTVPPEIVATIARTDRSPDVGEAVDLSLGLLNPGDAVEVLLLTDGPPKISIRGRVAGVPTIEGRVGRPQAASSRDYLLGIGVVALAAMALAYLIGIVTWGTRLYAIEALLMSLMAFVPWMLTVQTPQTMSSPQ